MTRPPRQARPTTPILDRDEHHHHHNAGKTKWSSATKANPCPVCGNVNRCKVAPDGGAAHCFRSDGGTLLIDVDGQWLPKDKTIEARKAKASTSTSTKGKPKPTSTPRTFASLDAAAHAIAKQLGGVQGGTWTYQDAAGNDAFASVRIDIAGGKEFRPLHRSKGKWKVGDPDSPVPLYRLPTLLNSTEAVFVGEGEKCADVLAAMGLSATTTAHGAKMPGRSDLSPLDGRDVVVVRDHDAAGMSYAEALAKLLLERNDGRTVRIVDLPGLESGEDVADWCGGDRPEVRMEELIDIAAATKPVSASAMLGGLKLIRLADIEPEPVQWLWQERFARGAVNVLGSDPGMGKTALVCDLAARITSGLRFQDDAAPAEIGSVLIANAEDDPASVLVPRLLASGADMSRVHLVDCVTERSADGKAIERSFNLEYTEMLGRTLRQLPDCRLVVIDPLGSYYGKSDAHKDSDVRGLFAPLMRIAREHNVAVLVIMHRRKSFSRGADESLLGGGVRGLSRSVWHLYLDPDDPDSKRICFVQGKTNVGPRKPGLIYEVVGATVTSKRGPVSTAKVCWLEGTLERSADDLHRAGQTTSNDNDAKLLPREKAEAWLVEYLEGGPMGWKDIAKQGRDAGHTEPTLRAIRHNVAENVTEKKVRGKTFWRLIDDPREKPEPEPDPTLPGIDDNEEIANVAGVENVDPSPANGDPAKTTHETPDDENRDSSDAAHTCHTCYICGPSDDMGPHDRPGAPTSARRVV